MLFASRETERMEGLLSGYASAVVSADRVNEHKQQMFSELIGYAGLDALAQSNLCKRLVCYLFIFIALAALFNFLPALFLFCLINWLELKKLQAKADQRAKLFERDYPAFLLSLAASVRTGLDPLVAFHNCAKLFTDDSLLKKELEQFKDKLDQGLREEVCIREFAKQIKHPDVELLRSALILARKEGSSLGLCLLRLSKITRQRQSFRRKIKAALGMQKLSAIGIALCAAVIATIQVIANLEGFKIALANPIGLKLLILGISLMLVGLIWMLNMAKERL